MGESCVSEVLCLSYGCQGECKKKKSSMYLEDTTNMSPRAIRDKVNGFRKD